MISLGHRRGCSSSWLRRSATAVALRARSSGSSRRLTESELPGPVPSLVGGGQRQEGLWRPCGTRGRAEGTCTCGPLPNCELRPSTALHVTLLKWRFIISDCSTKMGGERERAVERFQIARRRRSSMDLTPTFFLFISSLSLSSLLPAPAAARGGENSSELAGRKRDCGV